MLVIDKIQSHHRWIGLLVQSHFCRHAILAFNIIVELIMDASSWVPSYTGLIKKKTPNISDKFFAKHLCQSPKNCPSQIHGKATWLKTILTITHWIWRSPAGNLLEFLLLLTSVHNFACYQRKRIITHPATNSTTYNSDLPVGYAGGIMVQMLMG